VSFLRVKNGEKQSESKENSRQIARKILQDVRGLGTEKVVGHTTAESRSKTLVFRALHEHDEHHEQARNNVNHEQNINQDIHEKGGEYGGNTPACKVLWQENLLTLTPIYDFLKARGHTTEGDAVLVHSWPVLFLPAESALLREAVEKASEIDFEEVPARVMTTEHLMAIALQTGRGKDFARLVTFMEAGVVDSAKLHDLLHVTV